jgi:hypothetical protein
MLKVWLVLLLVSLYSAAAFEHKFKVSLYESGSRVYLRVKDVGAGRNVPSEGKLRWQLFMDSGTNVFGGYLDDLTMARLRIAVAEFAFGVVKVCYHSCSVPRVCCECGGGRFSALLKSRVLVRRSLPVQHGAVVVCRETPHAIP